MTDEAENPQTTETWKGIERNGPYMVLDRERTRLLVIRRAVHGVSVLGYWGVQER